ncbi:PO113 protein, partial [Alcedo cyanopectus]|nr:PO113 protein [Ceyx cyanopectus]
LAFSVLGVPSTVKSDNGPAYALQKTWQLLHLWGVDHTLGIPHSSTCQAIVECSHST